MKRKIKIIINHDENIGQARYTLNGDKHIFTWRLQQPTAAQIEADVKRAKASFKR